LQAAKNILDFLFLFFYEGIFFLTEESLPVEIKSYSTQFQAEGELSLWFVLHGN
jgi:hypothetical protein